MQVIETVDWHPYEPVGFGKAFKGAWYVYDNGRACFISSDLTAKLVTEKCEEADCKAAIDSALRVLFKD